IETRWVRFVPIKVNIFIWRARQDCLPTRVNLVRRGINVDSCVCPICSSGEDEINHILFRCDLAQQVLRRICRWWELDPSYWITFQEWYAWFSSIRFSSKSKSLLEGTFFVAWWHIWRIRNRIIFEGVLPRRSEIYLSLKQTLRSISSLSLMLPPGHKLHMNVLSWECDDGEGFNLIQVEIIRILAGQIIRFAAMSGSTFSLLRSGAFCHHDRSMPQISLLLPFLVRVDVDRCVTITVGDSSEQRECNCWLFLKSIVRYLTIESLLGATMPLGLKEVATSLLRRVCVASVKPHFLITISIPRGCDDNI
ncbi:RNA-directed DNA polymerase, eukaryota, partial [Tanacetum coccineum]